MRRVLDNRFLLAVTVLLLQFSVGETLHAAELPSHPVDATMAAMHLHNCGSDECPMGDCPSQQCSTGASPACHCSCVQIPSLVAGELTFVANPHAMTTVADIPGSAPRRLENPFRPPA
jgi:hypothetical protein